MDSPIAGCSISHAWLPQAEQGNECKMPSWLKMRIITGVVRWAPTAAPCHLTAHSSVESLAYLSLFLWSPHSHTSAPLHTHTHTQGSLIRDVLTQTVFCSIDSQFFFFVIRAGKLFYICAGLNLLFPCVALTRVHEIWQAHQTWRVHWSISNLAALSRNFHHDALLISAFNNVSLTCCVWLNFIAPQIIQFYTKNTNAVG